MAPYETLLFLLFVSFSGCSGLHYVTVREGEDATLSCGSVISPRCEADWHFLEKSRSTPLFIKGQDDAPGRSLLKNCSLFLNNVTREQAGYYGCTPAHHHKQEASTDTVLSVITVAEHREGAVLTLTCSVTTEDFYKPRLTWLIEGEEVPEDHQQLKISHSNSTISVSFNNLDRTSEFYHSVSCQITDDKQHPEKKSETNIWPFRDFLLRHAVVSTGLAALLVCVGACHIWTRTIENQTKRNSQRTRPSVRYMDYDDFSDIYEVIEDPSV